MIDFTKVSIQLLNQMSIMNARDNDSKIFEYGLKAVVALILIGGAFYAVQKLSSKSANKQLNEQE